MLDHKELDIIINKKKLSNSDIILLHDHVDYIGDIKDNNETLPEDVFNTLQHDLEMIIDRLELEREMMLEANPSLRDSPSTRMFEEEFPEYKKKGLKLVE